MTLLTDFKKLPFRGSVVDLAVALIGAAIGTAQPADS